ncbi:hypothetical protein BC939DRAFT_495024 [Gamsiella multidivaricata]|uniref:uncharacterized protein n=1 Tax=Gamsiella multidivaricata TaxID=101098 RepID=UPI0022202245|nr:uncharacterized protein BC939DRAFT_495024 [Gamsiella multidivaricata]KAI7819835.1 hypothetical protein BC939DRAFT_495024 [Gamsiella multidivaricata]
MPLTRSSCFYVSSLFFLVAVTGICIFASAYDVIFQIFHPANLGDPPNYKNLAVFGGSYVLLGLLATIFGFSRYVTVKLARQAIPKAYMPITREDLPKTVYEFVQSELDRVARLVKKAQPLLEESGQPGWGKPESSLQDTHFKTFMASTPHFIERAAVANSPDLARPPNMSISAYIHMLMDQKLITRDIGLEYIAGYEQARFGSSRNDPLPVAISPLRPHQHHQRHQQPDSGRHPRQPSGASSRHPNQDPSTVSTAMDDGNASHLARGTGKNAEEEDYIRFMKVLSWILQELGWDEETEDLYEQECREQERLQQQRDFGTESLGRVRSRQEFGQENENRYGCSSGIEHTRSPMSARTRNSRLSGESYYLVDESEVQAYSQAQKGTGSSGGGRLGGVEVSEALSRSQRKLSRSGNLSTRSLLTMRTMRTGSTTRS